jgi:hypothetical protein
MAFAMRATSSATTGPASCFGSEVRGMASGQDLTTLCRSCECTRCCAVLALAVSARMSLSSFSSRPNIIAVSCLFKGTACYQLRAKKTGLSRESTLSQLTVFLVRIPPHPTDEHRRASHVRHHTSPSVSCTDHMLLSRDRACAASLEDSQELQPSSGRERSCRSKSVDGRLSSVDGFSRLSLHTWATEAPEHGHMSRISS